MTSPRSILARLSPAYFIETGWLVAGTVSKLLIQMGTLYYLTGSLGRDGVGSFFAVIGLLTCLVPFVQLGNYDLTIRQIARREDPQAVAGRAMRSTFAAFVLFLPVLVPIKYFFVHEIGWPAFAAVVASELMLMRVVSNVQALATGYRQHYVCAVSDFLMGLSRLIAVYTGAKLGGGVNAMLLLYSATSLPATFATYGWMVWRYGTPHFFGGGSVLAELRDHGRMVTAWFCEMAAREGDKPLLNALSTPGDVGIYGTATKLLSVCLIPIDLLTQVFRPRVSQAYADGHETGVRLGRVMTLALAGIGLLTGLGLVGVMLLLPRVFPQLAQSQFADARIALLYLSVIPPVYGLQRAGVITAISRGATGVYAVSTAVGVSLSVSTNLLLVHRLGWRGTCCALLVYMVSSSAALKLLGDRAARRAADPIPAGPTLADSTSADSTSADSTSVVPMPLVPGVDPADSTAETFPALAGGVRTVAT